MIVPQITIKHLKGMARNNISVLVMSDVTGVPVATIKRLLGDDILNQRNMEIYGLYRYEWQGPEQIAKRFGLTKRTIEKIIKSFDKKGKSDI